MTVKEENGKVILGLEGRIDSNNAGEVEKQVMEALAAHAGMMPVINMGKLAYISSAGLRVLMKIRKRAKVPVDVLDCSPEVYEILDTTGFTQLLNVRKKLREVSVEGCPEIGSGGYSVVYRLDPETIIKVYKPQLSQEFVEKERGLSQKAFVHGVPTAISYDVVSCGDSYGVVYELLNANKAVFDIFGCESLEAFKELTGFTFRGMVHPDDYERISASIEDQVKKSQGDLDYVEYRIIRRDGGIRWLDDYGHYIEYDDQNSLYHVFISDVTDKHEREESDKAMYSAVIEALTRPYDSVWRIDNMETQHFELYRVDEKMAHLLPARQAAKISRFSDAFAFYSRLVLEEDRQHFLDAVTPENIIRNTENRMVYSVLFRRVFEDGTRYYRLEFVRLDLDNREINVVVGFRDVNEEMCRDQLG